MPTNDMCMGWCRGFRSPTLWESRLGLTSNTPAPTALTQASRAQSPLGCEDRETRYDRTTLLRRISFTPNRALMTPARMTATENILMNSCKLQISITTPARITWGK
jgi:hypothetical protein